MTEQNERVAASILMTLTWLSGIDGDIVDGGDVSADDIMDMLLDGCTEFLENTELAAIHKERKGNKKIRVNIDDL